MEVQKERLDRQAKTLCFFSLLGLDLLIALFLSLLGLETQNQLNCYKIREFSLKYSAEFYFSLACRLVLSFGIEDEDASPCRIEDAVL
jgi:hypothetical protein